MYLLDHLPCWSDVHRKNVSSQIISGPQFALCSRQCYSFRSTHKLQFQTVTVIWFVLIIRHLADVLFARGQAHCSRRTRGSWIHPRWDAAARVEEVVTFQATSWLQAAAAVHGSGTLSAWCRRLSRQGAVSPHQHEWRASLLVWNMCCLCANLVYNPDDD